MSLTIRRQGDQLAGQPWAVGILRGALNIYPESETNFFCTINDAQFTFIKDDKREVTAVIHYMEGRLRNPLTTAPKVEWRPRSGRRRESISVPEPIIRFSGSSVCQHGVDIRIPGSGYEAVFIPQGNPLIRIPDDDTLGAVSHVDDGSHLQF
jgi:hypothetical protein